MRKAGKEARKEKKKKENAKLSFWTKKKEEEEQKEKERYCRMKTRGEWRNKRRKEKMKGLVCAGKGWGRDVFFFINTTKMIEDSSY